ncbi:hypothetical protein SISSUDRAFT_1046772 [Sistotremastrum suecicum HHB10207 ss-3]|uniref:Uncharacterized protein n=1 Tax=Sistotremastrum suecicum HHB10207 ss-3 TaxID=1314776 RepID=A0A166DK19_9AGAM|nr:hypothetical protein SISSUDRAFT_1046772 [Sistotremastrum suecicum HHB10207 ss-3]
MAAASAILHHLGPLLLLVCSHANTDHEVLSAVAILDQHAPNEYVPPATEAQHSMAFKMQSFSEISLSKIDFVGSQLVQV